MVGVLLGILFYLVAAGGFFSPQASVKEISPFISRQHGHRGQGIGVRPTLFAEDSALRCHKEVMVGASFCDGNGGDPADQKRARNALYLFVDALANPT